MNNYDNQPMGEDFDKNKTENQTQNQEFSGEDNSNANYFGNDFNSQNTLDANTQAGFDGYNYAGGDLYENNEADKRGLGIASMVLGIVSIVCCCIGGYAIITAILAIIFSAIRMKVKSDGFAIAGLVTGIIGIVFNGFIWIAYLAGLEEYLYELAYELESFESIIRILLK